MTGLDLNDPMVRAMADRNHVPAEMWDINGRVRVYCETCAQDWPCATRTALGRPGRPPRVDITPDPGMSQMVGTT